jgi:hypothetical protein
MNIHQNQSEEIKKVTINLNRELSWRYNQVTNFYAKNIGVPNFYFSQLAKMQKFLNKMLTRLI